MEEWDKERVRRFLSSNGGIVEIAMHVKFKKYTPSGYQKEIPDEIFTVTRITTEMFNAVKDTKNIFELEIMGMGNKIYNLIKSVLKK